MSYQLPQFDLSYGTEDGPIHYYTAAQMQAAWQAGRDAMKAECVKVCETQNSYGDPVEYWFKILADKIKELK